MKRLILMILLTGAALVWAQTEDEEYSAPVYLDNPDSSVDGPYLLPPNPTEVPPTSTTTTEQPTTPGAAPTSDADAAPSSVTISIPQNPPAPKLSAKEQKQAAQESKDRALADRIRNRIYQYSGGYAKTVKIVTQNGKVVLQGEVPEQRDRLYIEKTAQAEAGAKNVKNELKTYDEVRVE